VQRYYIYQKSKNKNKEIVSNNLFVFCFYYKDVQHAAAVALTHPVRAAIAAGEAVET
jgi:hypothetical protein